MLKLVLAQSKGHVDGLVFKSKYVGLNGKTGGLSRKV